MRMVWRLPDVPAGRFAGFIIVATYTVKIVNPIVIVVFTFLRQPMFSFFKRKKKTSEPVEKAVEPVLETRQPETLEEGAALMPVPEHTIAPEPAETESARTEPAAQEQPPAQEPPVREPAIPEPPAKEPPAPVEPPPQEPPSTVPPVQDPPATQAAVPPSADSEPTSSAAMASAAAVAPSASSLPPQAQRNVQSVPST